MKSGVPFLQGHGVRRVGKVAHLVGRDAREQGHPLQRQDFLDRREPLGRQLLEIGRRGRRLDRARSRLEAWTTASRTGR